MKALNATIFTLALASSLVTLASSQPIGRQEVRKVTPEQCKIDEVTFKASAIARRARDLFRQGRIEEAEHLATEAIQIFEPVRIPLAEADDILAEAAMLRKSPREALRLLHDFPDMPDGLLSFRGQTTRALALIALGRVEDARTALTRAAGTSEEPSQWRCNPGVWDLPMDDDRSPQALSATAFLMRAASSQQSLNDPEVLKDLRVAERLAPGAVAIRLMLAKCLLQLDKIDDSERYYTLVAAVNEPRARAAGKFGLERIRSLRSWRKANPIGR